MYIKSLLYSYYFYVPYCVFCIIVLLCLLLFCVNVYSTTQFNSRNKYIYISTYCEASRFSRRKHTNRILCVSKPAVYYLVHESPSLASILSQTNPVHSVSNFLLNICSNTNLISKHRFSKRFFPSGLSTITLSAFLYSLMRVRCPTHFIQSHFFNLRLFDLENQLWRKLCSCFQVFINTCARGLLDCCSRYSDSLVLEVRG